MNETKRNKKNLPVFSIVLAVGLAILYFLHFNGANKTEVNSSQNENPSIVMPAAKSGSIAFVNSEELLKGYKLVSKLTGKVDKERQKKDADFSARQSEYEQEAAYFQQQVQQQSISEQSAQDIYQQLMAKQEELYQLQQKYNNELSQFEYEMNVTLLDSIRNYLNRMNVKTKFDYILNLDGSGNILVAKDTFDITPQVVQGLNYEYDLKYTTK